MFPSTRLSGVMEALRFVEHVMGVGELKVLTTSRRCVGAAATKCQGPKRQASPFLVQELKTLHAVVIDEARNIWDRIFLWKCVGSSLFTQSVVLILQQSSKMILDRDASGQLAFLEFIIEEHKCVGASVFRNSHLHAVAPCLGVVDDSWAEKRLMCRSSMDLVVGASPVMPAPNISGAPTSRPLSTAEMKLWVHQLLQFDGHTLESRRVTSHSCKTTMLSFSAKYGIEWTDRMVLGGHVAHLKSVITYSRDSLARPLQLMANMLQSIRNGRFQPDNTRSGRFVEQTSDEYEASIKSWNLIDNSDEPSGAAVAIPVVVNSEPVVVSDDDEAKEEVGDTPGSFAGVEEVDSSDDDLDLTSSSSDEEAADGCPSNRTG